MSNDNDVRPFNEPDREPESLPNLPEPAPAAPCPDCRGSGRTVLLTSSRACRRCGGNGRLAAGTTPAGDPNPRPAAPRDLSDTASRRPPKRTIEEPDGEVRTYTYDLYGRLTSVTYTRRPCGEIAVWRYDRFAGPENAGHPGGGEPAASEPAPPALCAECGGTGVVTFPNGSMLCTKCRRR